jgi:hypothetical protein
LWRRFITVKLFLTAITKTERALVKKVFIAMLLFSLAGLRDLRADDTASSNTLVWCGIDYSMVKMIGTTDFNQPGEIFPGMLLEWNGLFMTEMLPKLEKMAGDVATDLDAVREKNEKASPKQIVREDGTMSEIVDATTVTDKDIAREVNSYGLKKDQGLGLVFIMDRLVKTQERGCLYMVFFDIKSRKVIYSERFIGKAGGFGFRNYWFRPIKDAVDKLPKMYKVAIASKP